MNPPPLLTFNYGRDTLSADSSYTCPGVFVFETNIPNWANVLGVHISAKVPPPPSATQRLGDCPSQRRRRSGSAVWLLLYGFVPLPWPPGNRTSTIIACSPARHRTPTARGFTPPVYTPKPLSIFVPPEGAEMTARGTPTRAKPGTSSARSICVEVG